MENDNQNMAMPPVQPPQPKKWYQHKGIISIIILAVITAIAVWAYAMMNPPQDLSPIVVSHKINKPQTINSTPAEAQQATVTPVSINGWQTYINSAYGFQLTFPESWKGYRTQDGLDFEVPTTATWVPTTGWFLALQIIPYSEDQWQQVQSQEGPTPVFIADDGKTVFTWQGSQDTPDDLTGKINPEDIIKTFKLISPISKSRTSTSN